MGGVLWEVEHLGAKTAEQTGRYEALLRAQSELGQVVVMTEGDRIVYANDAFAELVGPDLEITNVRSLYDVIVPAERDAFRDRVDTHVRSGRSITTDVPIQRADGERRYLELALKPFGRTGGGRLVMIARDLTDRTHAENALAHQALHDRLTGLPNRTLLHDRLEHAILEARRRNEPLALLLIDLDQFKAVNDSFGHHVGDALLTQVRPRFQTHLRETDTVARLRGDEFAVILPGTDHSAAGRVATTLLKALERPFVVEAEALPIGASVGIAMYPAQGDADA